MNDAKNFSNLEIRVRSQRKWYNKIDIVYLFLDRVVFERLFKPKKRNMPGKYEILDVADVDFLVENLHKHRTILWVNVLLSIYLYFFGIDRIFANGDATTIITGLLAPAMITGGAWYAVTFGGVPEKLIRTALTLTFLMYLSFTLSMTLLMGLLIKISPWEIGLFVIFPLYISLYIASVLYDNIDGLKIGLDTALLKFSRASLNYYQKHGFLTKEETQSEVFEKDSAPNEGQIAMFQHYLTTLDRSLQQLQNDRDLSVANSIIASSTEILFNIIDLSLPDNRKLDRGDGFNDYLQSAYDKDQRAVDSSTATYLIIAVNALKALLDTTASNELDSVLEKLAILSHKKYKSGKENIEQKKADIMFYHLFQQLLSLINAYRHILFKKRI